MLQMGKGVVLRTRARHKATNTWHVAYGEVIEDSDRKLVIACVKKQKDGAPTVVMKQTFLLSEWDSFDNCYLGDGLASIRQ